MRAKPIHTISVLASALALALPSSSFALGLGRLTVESGLGQPLSAQIELNSASREELDSIAARIADSSLYRQNNLAFPAVLTRARVTLERTPGGQAFLRIATPTPVNEPYLDLLVELNWASGRVVRSYTFLLDPPGMQAPTPTIEPVAPVRSGAPRAAAAPAAAPAAPSSRATASAGAGGSGAGAGASGAGGQTYPVRRGDTLARIAGDLRPEGVTLEQMLVALFNANPGAFDGNNMNRLRAGAILQVPAPEAASGTPAHEATRTVRMQAADWGGYRDRIAANVPASAAGASRESSGTIGAAVQDRTPQPQPGQDQVRVSREAGLGKGAGSTSAVEDAVARDRALKDAQTRIAELEKTLRDLQRALEMRNPAMAQLQNQAATKGAPAGAPSSAPAVAGATGAAAAGATTGAVPGPLTSPTPVAKAPETGRAIEPAKAPALTPPAVTSTTPAAPPVAAKGPDATPASASPAPATSAAPVAPSTTTSSTATTTAAEKKAPAKADTAASPSFFEDLVSNPPTWMLAGGGLIVLGGLAAVIASRRRKAGHFEDSIISGTDIKSNTVFGSTGGGIVNTGENSLATDFTNEGLTNVDTDEVDPIAEAEVYLAYGRDAQAEEILKDALKKDPQRQEIYLKLLEIHAQHNKPSVFEQVATELYAVSKGQGETWQKAVALGRQLDPNNPMFAGDGASSTGAIAAAGAAASAAASAAAMRFHDSEDPLRRGPDPSHPQAVPPVPVSVADIRNDEALDFRLADDISIAPAMHRKASLVEPTQPPAPMRSTPPTGTPSTDLAFTPPPQVQPQVQPTPSRVAEPALSVEQQIEVARAQDPSFDLDFHLEDAEKPAPMRAAPEFARSSAAPELSQPQASVDLDKLDLNFGPEPLTAEDPTPSVLDGQWHDAATKLDLAKAYHEMGDTEGAREILQEVVHEGDDSQRAEASALLAKLG